MKVKTNPAVKATIKHFADDLRNEGLSPSMREIEIAIAVERLREEHGIVVSEEQLARLAR